MLLRSSSLDAVPAVLPVLLVQQHGPPSNYKDHKLAFLSIQRASINVLAAIESRDDGGYTLGVRGGDVQ